MKRTGRLFGQLTDFSWLRKSARRAARGKRQSDEVCAFLMHLESEVLTLQRELVAQTYYPGPYRTFKIYEHKEREICAAPFRDRVVHHALCGVLEPTLE